MSKKRLKQLSLLLMVSFLSACTRIDSSTGQPHGWFYEYLVVPTQGLINWLAGLMGGNYGWAIIVFTILVRVIILPLTVNQQKATTRQQAKMKSVEHITKDIQKDLNEADTQEQKMAYQQELADVYKEAGISLTGGMGCLPLLIQLPIISMVFSAIRYSPDIASATFFGQSLGERSILLAVLAGLVYFVQSWLMIRGMPEEQQKQMRATAFMSPAMIFFFSLSSPAGIALYWLFGGIFAIGQQYYTTEILKPKLEKEAEEQMEDINITRKKTPLKEVNQSKVEKAPKNSAKSKSHFEKKSGGRNAGKQKRK